MSIIKVVEYYYLRNRVYCISSSELQVIYYIREKHPRWLLLLKIAFFILMFGGSLSESISVFCSL